jgi:hypothetical protein
MNRTVSVPTNRLRAVAHLHTVNLPATVGWPWGIMASSFVINLVLFALIGDRMEGDATTGGLASLYVTVMAVAAGWITQVFPFALGMSVTRREFYLATCGYAAIQAVAFAVPLYLLDLVENATGGWGVSMHFFGVIEVYNGPLQVLVFTVPLLLMSFVGIFGGVIFNRWGSNGMFALLLATGLVLGAVAVLITWRDAWPATGRWFGDQTAGLLFAGWPLLASLVLAGTGYLIIRRSPA